MKHIGLGISTRVFLAVAAIIAIGMTIYLAEDQRTRRQMLVNEHARLMENALDMYAAKLRLATIGLRRHVIFLSQTPPVAGIVRATQNGGIDPRDGNSLTRWEQRLTDIFVAFAEANPEYTKLRFIGVADEGRELVRVDRLPGQLHAVPNNARQRKQDRYYFRETAQLLPGQVYLSEIDFNRENGAVNDTPVRTLRAATPVFDSQGKLFGMVVLSFDIGSLLDTLHYEQPPLAGIRPYVVDRHGQYLLHHDPSREFAFEFGRKTSLADELPLLAPILDPQQPASIPFADIRTGQETSWFSARRVHYDPASSQSFMVVLYALPDETLQSGIRKNQPQWRVTTVLLGLAILSGIMLGLHLLMRPLHQLANAAQAFSEGKKEIALPTLPYGEIGALTQAFARMRDKISEREEVMEAEIRRKTAHIQLAQSVIDHTAEGVAVCDAAACFISVNPAFTHITGYTAEEVTGQSTRLLKSDHHDPVFYQNMWETLLRTGTWQGEVWNRRKNGEAYLEWLTINKVRNSDSDAAYVCVFSDITELQRKDERIRHLAYHDALTGLPNRMLLQDRLKHAIVRATRDGMRLAVMFIDLDRFKQVNDTLGHEAGDRLLVATSQRLGDKLRASDTVARIGGDEFVILLEQIGPTANVDELANALIATVSEPLELHGEKVQVGASIGIALYPNDGEDVHALMKHADIAMYAAKTAGRNTSRYFNANMTDAANRRNLLDKHLREAIALNQLALFYQPKACLTSGSVQSVEALLRWHHPERGLIAPDEFIPLAEESNLIVDIGNWVLQQALAQVANWHSRGIKLGVAVNLSARQLAYDGLVDHVRNLLQAFAIPASALELELTESSMMADIDRARQQLNLLKNLGVRIAIDDFGTGYSSLAHLRRLPVDVIKIDRSFVGKADRDANDAIVVKTILSLAQALGLDVVAEGVETEAQATLLREAGCQTAQGHLLSYPLPADELESWLANHPGQAIRAAADPTCSRDICHKLPMSALPPANDHDARPLQAPAIPLIS